MIKNILVTGGAGYIGSVLIPTLLEKGYKVKNIDLYLYGNDVLKNIPNRDNLIEIKGDIRDIDLLKKEIKDFDSVIHLACISNDASFDFNPDLGKSINYDAFIPLINISKESGIKRFIYTSTSSVYGVKKVDIVTENMEIDPLTDYSKYKVLCEEIVLKFNSPDFVTTIIRPATVCGYSPRQRLDLTVNNLINQAINIGKISVFGGSQKRPNINIHDIVDLYVNLLEYEDDLINGQIFNVGYENQTILKLAELVRQTVSSMQGTNSLTIEIKHNDDLRTYCISSEKIKNVLGFTPKQTVQDAIKELFEAFKNGLLPNPLNDNRYYNINKIKEINLS